METVAAVDWGTSSFRLWVLDAAGAVLAERRSAEGMSTLAQDRFEPVLRSHLASLPEAERPSRVVICGMAGARQGWREAPYADVPVSLPGIVSRAVTVPAEGLDVRILPGLASRDETAPDVLRGEETQLLGLALDDPALGGLVCMPGTHTKWVLLEKGAVRGFSTVMTGELFALLSKESILRHTLAGEAPTGDPAADPFRAGLATALADPGGLVARLFGIRAGGLLFGTAGSAAADRLSGLLVGADVAAGLGGSAADEPVVLVASGRLADIYAAALQAAGRTVRPVDADDAVRHGLFHAARQIWPG
ncbi:2-dehydro-3-deoxygalactonokinase [Chthonobacter rhizosphaerae]|uniref:2-dehydro-3-deoxygalactonokinase n=1 Tax=Chthonobacter rhizosphaerae TaxID=2735553 RepID=UPI0015EFC111|nr:2-dehydro-3-deoxygalactonokinase [Chthonobacter rhizosphaerae]